MGSSLAIASVTAVLKNILDNALVKQSMSTGVGDVSVSALPPDRIPVGTEECSQLNLYLYRVTPNSGWRSSSGGFTDDVDKRNPPLALDLHYLLTAYAERDFQAEILLGCALQTLHETPILTREAIRAILTSSIRDGAGGAPPTLAALADSDLANQVEQMKIRPTFVSMEEMSRLWSGFQARYRLSVTYEILAVLIDDRRPIGADQKDAAQVARDELQPQR